MEYIKLERVGDQVVGEASINGEIHKASFEDMILATVWAEEVATMGRKGLEGDTEGG